MYWCVYVGVRAREKESSMSQRHYTRRQVLSMGSALCMLVGLSACGTQASPDTKTQSATYEPVSVTHMYGTTKIEKLPQKIVCLGWGSTDALLSLGIIPVAFNKQETSVDGQMVIFPWIQKALENLGAHEGSKNYPKLLNDQESQYIQEVAALQPDLICAKISGMTQEDYEQLSKIAPVIAPEEAWMDGWVDTLDTYAKILMLEDKAREVKEHVQAQFDAVKQRHPEWVGKTYATGAFATATGWSAYNKKDNRSVMLEGLGLAMYPGVEQAFAKETSFYLEWPSERASEVDPDLLWSWVIDAETVDMLKSDPLLSQMPALRDDHAVLVAYDTDMPYVSAMSNTSALSIPWILERLESDISQHIKKS